MDPGLDESEKEISDDEESKWKGMSGETVGEYPPVPGEREDRIVMKRRISSEASVGKLDQLKDQKLMMMKQVKNILYNLITDRPENVIDYFEEYVRYIITKDDKVISMSNVFAHYFDVDKLIAEQSRWFTLEMKQEEEMEVAGEGEPAIKKEYIFRMNMEQFIDGGVALTQIELFGIAFSLQLVAETFNLTNIKFWGKILGLYMNYYILEADVTPDMIKKDVEEIRAQRALEKQLKQAEEKEYVPKMKWERVKKLAQYVKPPMPKTAFIPLKFAPKERLGTGLNKKVYLVSNYPAGTFVRLPDVLPIDIVRARQIKQFFTGILNQEMITYPQYPGRELTFLRAQIARISAGTHISPLGYYTFNIGEGGFEDEEEEENGEEEMKMGKPKPDFAINPDFEPVPMKDIVDPSMAFWVHHSSHILPQGRAVWVDPYYDPDKPKPEGGEDPDAKKNKPEPEVGPPLLTSTSDDMNLEMIPPWCTRVTMDLSPANGAAFVRSNLWPGAFAYAMHNEINFDNVYIGWGFKQNALSFTPLVYFVPQNEYEIGPEVMEITDPNPEEEDYEGILYQQKMFKGVREVGKRNALTSKPEEEEIL